MASFPSLQPSSRAWTPGGFGLTSIQTLSGASSRVSHASTRYGDQLQLTFVNRSEADSALIATHYNGQGGGRDSFSLPAAVFSGLDSYSNIISSGNRWVYSRSPQIEHVDADVHTITVDLEQVLS